MLLSCTLCLLLLPTQSPWSAPRCVPRLKVACQPWEWVGHLLMPKWHFWGWVVKLPRVWGVRRSSFPKYLPPRQWRQKQLPSVSRGPVERGCCSTAVQQPRQGELSGQQMFLHQSPCWEPQLGHPLSMASWRANGQQDPLALSFCS